MKLRVLIFLYFLKTIFCEKVLYNNATVYRVFPETQQHLEALRNFEEGHNGEEISIWNEIHGLNPVDVMVQENYKQYFYQLMKDLNIQYTVFIENIQSLLNKEAVKTNLNSSFDWQNYYPLENIYSWLNSLGQKYPGVITPKVVGNSYEGRPIRGVKLSYKKNNPAVFVEAGTHAREWISPATATYLLDQLLTNNNTDVRFVAENYDWYFAPSVNPDGYEYTHTTERLWRKTRKPYGKCFGADMNRNWGYKWMTGGSSNNSCSPVYAGSAPFSEPESESISKFLSTIQNQLKAYIALHSYSQLFLIPYGYTTAHLENYDEVIELGKKALAKLKQRYGTVYKSGNFGEALYIGSGTSIDWVKATFGTPIVCLYELRDQGKYGFILPPDQIIPTGEETLDSIVELLKEGQNITRIH